MKVLLLSCSTGEGHNHCAAAVRQALERRGCRTDFFDMLHLFGEPGPVSMESLLNVISTKVPGLFGLMYKAGEKVSGLGVTSPVYLVNSTYGRRLSDLISEHGYDAVVCSHLFPMETLTYIRRTCGSAVPCYGILSDYTCIPFLAETALDGYFLPHALVRQECAEAGIPEERLIVTGMPVAEEFRVPMTKAEARDALDVPQGAKLYLVMTGGIGCGDALGLCEKLLAFPDEDALLCVLAGRNGELLDRLWEEYGDNPCVRPVPFTDQVHVYMRAADVLLSKAGGISSAEAAAVGVPLVHTMMIPGVETRNAAFFSGLGMSFMAESFDEAARCADRIVYDGKTGAKIVEAQKRNLPADGAERIAAYIAAVPEKPAREEQLRRIEKNERLMNQARALLAAENRTKEAEVILGKTVAALEAYYGSEEWKRDFADDEAGLLPGDLKRGILSEDGLYDLLEEYREACGRKERGT